MKSLTLLLALMCFVLAPLRPLQAFQADPLTVETKTKLERLLKQLEAKSFGKRQLAATKIWELGPQIKPIIEIEVEKRSGDARSHLREILNRFNLGIDHETAPSIANLVMIFDTGDTFARERVIEQLIAARRHDVIFECLDRIKDKTERHQFYDDYIYLPNTLAQLAADENWKGFLDVFQNPLVQEIEPELQRYDEFITGKQQTRVAEIKERVEKKKATDTELAELSRYLIIRGDLVSAKAYLNKMNDRNSTLSTGTSVLMGDFEAAITMVANQHDPEDSKVIKECLLAFISGDTVALESQIAEIEKRLKSFGRITVGNRSRHTVLLNLLSLTLNFDSVTEHLSRKQKNEKFRLLSRFGRPREALALLDIDETVPSRMKWFAGAVKKLKLARRSTSITEDSEAFAYFNHVLEVCSLIATLGNKAEAAYYLNLLIDEIPVKPDETDLERSLIVSQFTQLYQPEIFWDLIERRFSETAEEYWYLTDDIFPDKMAIADFWYLVLAKEIPNPTLRLRTIAKIIDSPHGIEEPAVDIDALARKAVSFNFADDYFEKAEIHYQIAMTFFLNGRDVECNQHLQRAADLGDPDACFRLGVAEYSKQNFSVARKLFESVWTSGYEENNFLSLLYSISCARKLGNEEEAKNLLRLAFVNFSSFFQGDLGGQELIESFQIEGIEKEIELMFRIHLSDFRELEINYGAGRLSEAYSELVEHSDPKMSLKHKQIATLENYVMESLEHLPTAVYGAGGMELSRKHAAQFARNKEFEKAAEIIKRCTAFRKADTGAAQYVLPILDRFEDPQSIKLFKMLEADFADTLSHYPQSALYQNNYAWICACTKRRLDFGIECAKVAIDGQPYDTNYIDTLAELHYKKGNREKAIELMDRCTRLKPDDFRFQNRLRKYRAGLPR